MYLISEIFSLLIPFFAMEVRTGEVHIRGRISRTHCVKCVNTNDMKITVRMFYVTITKHCNCLFYTVNYQITSLQKYINCFTRSRQIVLSANVEIAELLYVRAQIDADRTILFSNER